MAVPSETHQTYQAKGLREDLSDIIHRVSPDETPFIDNIGKGKASATFHEWQTEALAAPVDNNAVIEGDDATTDAANATARVGNYCQISDKTARTSGTVDVVNKAGRGKELARQKIIKGLELRRDIEKQVLSNTASSAGNASTARNSGGLASWLETNTSFGAGGSAGGFSSGTTSAATGGTDRAFTETIVKDVMQSCFTEGSRPSQLYLGAFNKRAFSGFNGIADIRKSVEGKALATITGAADVYVSDFGPLTAIPHPYMDQSVAYFVNPDYVSISYLRPIREYKLAKTGDSERCQLLGEYTLCVKNEKAHGMAFDLTTS